MKFSNAPLTSTADLLRRVRKLLAVESRWTKGAYGRNANKKEVGPSSSAAVCWCLEGALRAVHADTWGAGLLLNGREGLSALKSIASFHSLTVR